MTIGNNIKALRKEKSLTQKQLAEKIGITDSAITRYESGSREPNIGTINKIAAALDVPVSRLLEDDTITLTNSITQFGYLEQYIKSLGYEIDGDLSEGYLIINAPDGTYEITEKDIEELETTTKSFILFKLQDIVSHSRKIGK